jgi:hypothetical protein
MKFRRKSTGNSRKLKEISEIPQKCLIFQEQQQRKAKEVHNSGHDTRRIVEPENAAK